MTKRIIDVSQFNGSIIWPSLASQVDGVIIRAGYRGYGSSGTLVTDTNFVANISGATSANIPVGVYFLSQAINESEAMAEANFVNDLIKRYKISLPVYFDSEWSHTPHTGRADTITAVTRTNCAIAFCNRIKTLGYTPGIYASESWFNSMMQFSRLSSFNIWVAKYSSVKPNISRYDAWQYSDSGRLTGISGNVDMSYFYMEDAVTKVTYTSYKNGYLYELPINLIDHIEYCPMSGTKGETVTAAAKRIKWNNRAPDIITNCELFNMQTYAPATSVIDEGKVYKLTEGYGFAFKNHKVPVFSYKNNINAPDYVGVYPPLILNGKKGWTSDPAGLGGYVARTAAAIKDGVFAIACVPDQTGSSDASLTDVYNLFNSRGYAYAGGLDGGGSTAFQTNEFGYEQGRPVRGFLCVWYQGGTGNKASKTSAQPSSSSTSTMQYDQSAKAGKALHVLTNGAALRLRDGGAKILKELANGTAVTWYGAYTTNWCPGGKKMNGKWYYVRCANGIQGYVSADYVK